MNPKDILVPARILIIEDNRDAADSLSVILHLSGFQVQVAYSGIDGLRIAREWMPDVILSDNGLPGLDRFQLASLLRQYPETAKVRLISLSGYATNEDRTRDLANDLLRLLFQVTSASAA